MLFNSYEFLALYLPLTVLLFYTLLRVGGRRLALVWLALASLVFYGWWEPRHLWLIGISLLGNYGCSQLIVRSPRGGRYWLIGGVGFNLALLGYYKYTHFLLASLAHLFDLQFSLPELLLPLAISFFTFQQIGFLVDCQRGQARPPNLLHYLLFVTFFPQLIAGPIVQHRQVVLQFQSLSRKVPWESVAQGLTLFSLGLFKKVLIADKLAEWSTITFDLVAAGQPIATLDAWGGTLAYTFQLYFDFSGYSDMALGLAGLFGIRLPRNFDSPYQARSIGELWNRWHITLSHFLRDYLFVPLGGSHRRRPLMTARNLIITMTLCGCWHGAGWTFLLFGALQGLLMSFHHYWRLHLRNRLAWQMPGFLAWLLTFGSFALTLVLFRATTLVTAGRMYQALVGWDTAIAGATLIGASEWLRILLMFPLVLYAPNAVRFVYGEHAGWSWRPRPAYAVMAVAMMTWCLLRLNENSEFLYFHF